MPNLTVLLPCLNEEQALPGLLHRLAAASTTLPQGWGLQVLVVDDGSTDATAEIAKRPVPGLTVHLVSHQQNLGLGAALVSGITWFLEHASTPEDILGAMDADGTHPPELLPAMLAVMLGGVGAPACDVVIASRYAPGGAEHGLPRRRRFYSKLASTVLSVLAPIRGARDYTCGYRLYRRAILLAAAEHYSGRLVTERSFVCMAELLIKLARRGARVGEVGLDLHYELKGGVSKMNVAATIKRYAVLALRLLFSRHYR